MIPDSQEIASGQNLAGRLLAVEFGVVLSRVIACIENDPAQLRSVVYELARSNLRIEAWRRNPLNNDLEARRLTLALESAIECVETVYSRHDELRALRSLDRLIESPKIGRSKVPLKTVSQASTQMANTDHLPLHSARAKGMWLSFRPSLQRPGAAPLLRGVLVAIFAVMLCAVLSHFGTLGRQATPSLSSQSKSEPMVQPAIARVNGAPFAHFRHRRFVAAASPAVSGGDAPRYGGDYDPSAVGPGERPVQPSRSSCSTQTYKVPSEAGGETSVSVVRCNGQ